MLGVEPQLTESDRCNISQFSQHSGHIKWKSRHHSCTTEEDIAGSFSAHTCVSEMPEFHTMKAPGTVGLHLSMPSRLSQFRKTHNLKAERPSKHQTSNTLIMTYSRLNPTSSCRNRAWFVYKNTYMSNGWNRKRKPSMKCLNKSTHLSTAEKCQSAHLLLTWKVHNAVQCWWGCSPLTFQQWLLKLDSKNVDQQYRQPEML